MCSGTATCTRGTAFTIMRFFSIETLNLLSIPLIYAWFRFNQLLVCFFRVCIDVRLAEITQCVATLFVSMHKILSYVCGHQWTGHFVLVNGNNGSTSLKMSVSKMKCKWNWWDRISNEKPNGTKEQKNVTKLKNKNAKIHVPC